MGTDGRLPCFVVMPFASELLPVYEKAIKPLFEESSFAEEFVCWRVDEVRLAVPMRITDQIIHKIRDCAFMIADITDSNPNVMFEIGYAVALERPIVIINQNIASSPFDIKDYRQIPYKTSDDGLNKLRTELRKTIQDIIPTFSHWHLHRLKYGSLEEQINAIRWLGNHGNIDAVDPLIDAGLLPSSRFREEAGSAIMRIAFKSPEITVKIAERAVKYLPKESIDNLLLRILEENPDTRREWDLLEQEIKGSNRYSKLFQKTIGRMVRFFKRPR